MVGMVLFWLAVIIVSGLGGFYLIRWIINKVLILRDDVTEHGKYSFFLKPYEKHARRRKEEKARREQEEQTGV